MNDFVCTICSKPVSTDRIEEEKGELWVYCKECDVWTAHPIIHHKNSKFRGKVSYENS